MCCFSRPVESVDNTKIFARGLAGESQQIVYSMSLKTAHDVAMILPIPSRPGASEKAVRFINLKSYPDFFSDMETGFPTPPSRRLARESLSETKSLQKLAIVQVGSFEASFVPTPADFARLDSRFRLPGTTWEALPRYRNYGFVVFKFRKGHQDVHPMAFEFPRTYANRIFFPTVHIHDGRLEKEAVFDHLLYCQLPDDDVMMLHGWRESHQPAGMFMHEKKSSGLIDPSAHVHRSAVKGIQANSDLWL
ncbi:MAG: hypothetical protein VX644_06805 [Planctomycetota bacterium]|nr:hypothetical protein [Planctomycetota bacterium]